MSQIAPVQDQEKKPGLNPAMLDDVAMGLRKVFRGAKMAVMQEKQIKIVQDPPLLRPKSKIAASKKREEEEKPSGLPHPPLISYLDDVAMILKGLKSNAPAIAETALKAASDGKHHQNTIGTTLESKIHESFTVASDRLFRSGVLNRDERKALSGAIGNMLREFQETIGPEIYARKMTDNAHEHLKAAVSSRFVKTRLVARDLANRQNVSGYALGEASKSVAKASLEAPVGEVRKILRGAVSFTRSMTKSQPQRTSEFVGKIKEKIGPQEMLA